jgi:NAD(P)-dependent dehydrogenase (short-subunit alcohol dehydrogenase family)
MKHILIIGGSSGIGLELVKLLADTNRLTLLSRNVPSYSNSNITHIPFDVLTSELPLDTLPNELDGMVYCPGTVNLKPFKMLNPQSFTEDLNLNFLGLIRVLHPLMDRFQIGSSLVLFSSVAATKGMPFHTSVSASKAAIEGFARALAAEYAPKIRVNVIAPSLVDTPLVARMLNHEKKRENMAARHPVGRYGDVTDIAQMAAFLLSENSSWISGQVIGVDGGISTLQTP